MNEENLRKNVLMNNAWKIEKLLRSKYVLYLIYQWDKEDANYNMDLLDAIQYSETPISHLFKR